MDKSYTSYSTQSKVPVNNNEIDEYEKAEDSSAPGTVKETKRSKIRLPHMKKIPDFSARNSAHSTISPAPTPLTIFQALFGRGVNTIVEQTNAKGWHNTRAQEIQVFVGVVIKMSIVKRESHCDDWSSNPDISVPYVNTVMPHDRFLQLMTFSISTITPRQRKKAICTLFTAHFLVTPKRHRLNTLSRVSRPVTMGR